MNPASHHASAAHDQLLHTAVDWLIRFESDTLSEADRLAFEHWRTADPAHEMAWNRVAGLLDDSLSIVRDAGLSAPGQVQATQRTLLGTRRRKFLRGALVFAGLGGASAIVANRSMPISQLMADLRTGTGQRLTFSLSDGSSVELNARSAADIDFNQDTRQLHLREGELIATVAPDAQRPFIVRTSQGTVQALGTRFLVSQRAAQSQVVVLEHSIDLRTHDGQQMRMREGEGALFTSAQIEPIAGNAVARAAWSDGMLAVENATLAEVVDAYKPYYSGLIRLSPAAAELRVFGVFPLDDPGHALRTLTYTLPLKMQHYGNWLISIDIKQA
ncbi:FecR family protein [Herminiimonas arsenitoxidans]|uniref:FecR family protein n=1 Tax=Herminiimonas arsenitoxidans TaxID=1809410 RepID=UPI0009712427|nr:FecR family protein [Herminiimonas arsenitoxidans]